MDQVATVIDEILTEMTDDTYRANSTSRIELRDHLLWEIKRYFDEREK